MKRCIACGMPMEKPEDYVMGDRTKDYCRYCARHDGTMQSYEEKRQSLIWFIIRTQGLAESAAGGVAETMMRDLYASITEHSCFRSFLAVAVKAYYNQLEGKQGSAKEKAGYQG